MGSHELLGYRHVLRTRSLFLSLSPIQRPLFVLFSLELINIYVPSISAPIYSLEGVLKTARQMDTRPCSVPHVPQLSRVLTPTCTSAPSKSPSNRLSLLLLPKYPYTGALLPLGTSKSRFRPLLRWTPQHSLQMGRNRIPISKIPNERNRQVRFPSSYMLFYQVTPFTASGDPIRVCTTSCRLGAVRRSP